MSGRAPIVDDSLPRRNAGRTVIVHVSDLHFTAATVPTEGIWSFLSLDLARHHADLVVVTGDLADNPATESLDRTNAERAMAAVDAYVRLDLCKAAGVNPERALLVVPGNHDYRTQGLVWLWRRETGALFAKFFERYTVNRLYPQLQLACFLFDSNAGSHQVNLASGRIGDDCFKRMKADLATFEASHRDLLKTCKRLAVVHHHPLPIGQTENAIDAWEQEQFVVLNNAGAFLTEIVRARVDLVLHGHKHHASYARAIVPAGDGEPAGVDVIAGGSVGKEHPFGLSYNVITLYDDGRVTLGRRAPKPRTYDDHGPTVSIVGYEDARRCRFESLAKARSVTLRLTHHVRRYEIVDRSGDAHQYEQFTGVRPFGATEVDSLPHTVESDTGIFGERTYFPEGAQQIAWNWDDAQSGGVRQARTTFTPPLRRDRPIAFARESRSFNAFHFNKRDRRDAQRDAPRADAGGEVDLTESVEFNAREAFEHAVIQITFPAGRWPERFALDAFGEAGAREPEETRFVERALTTCHQQRAVHLALDHPLPGYCYKISWELPDVEADELGLSPRNAGVAQEMVERLLSCRLHEYVRRRTEVERVLAAIRRLPARMVGAHRGHAGAPGKGPEVALFCYNETLGGLECVASAGFDGIPPPSQVFRPGQGVIGQAWRRRDSVLCYPRLGGADHTEAVYYLPSPGATGLHTALLAVPVVFPRHGGRHVAVISLASRDNVNPLMELQSIGRATAAGADVRDDAARRALEVEIKKYFHDLVAPVLEL
jgi:3',5'-cyclic AMP phosphodiesterase CpdA